MSDLSLFKIVGEVSAKDYDIFEDLGLGGDIKNILAAEVSRVGDVCVSALKSAAPRKTEQLRRSIMLEGRERGFLNSDSGRADKLENVRRVIIQGGFRSGKELMGEGNKLANTVTTNTALAEILNEGYNEASRELVSESAAEFFNPKRPRKFKSQQMFLRRKRKARVTGGFIDGEIPSTQKKDPTRNWIENAQNAAVKKIAEMQ